MPTVKRKKPNTPTQGTNTSTPAAESETSSPVTVKIEVLVEGLDSNAPSPAPSNADSEPPPQKHVFKDATFTHLGKVVPTPGPKRIRMWKSLKQICAGERALKWKPEDVTYSGIDAPPSFKPAKKYSDLSGLPAVYTDPQTKLRFSNAEEFARCRMLTSDIIAGLLAVRKANSAIP